MIFIIIISQIRKPVVFDYTLHSLYLVVFVRLIKTQRHFIGQFNLNHNEIPNKSQSGFYWNYRFNNY